MSTTATLTVRRADERGHTRIQWLDSRHSFSFGQYYDPEHPGFRSLRVINEDHVAPARGFGAHPHRDMEIISYVVSGALAHQDSLGNGSSLGPGRVQLMSAGRGVVHSELNPSTTEPVHFLQIWIEPSKAGLTPSYQELAVPDARGALHLVVSPTGRDGSLQINQDAALYVGTLDAGASLTHAVPAARHVWVQVVKGALTLNGEALVAGDGAALSGAEQLTLEATRDAELLLFELA